MFNLLLFFVYPASLISLSMYLSHAKDVTVDSYFFANRTTEWFVLGISFVMTIVCSPSLLGSVAPDAASWLPLAYGVNTVVMLVVVGWHVMPHFKALKIRTLPEFFEKRFSRSCQLFVSTLYLCSNVCLRMMFMLVVGNIFMTTLAGINAYSSLLFFLVVTGSYVIIGGLKAEMYAGMIQIVFVALGAVVFTGWIVQRGGGITLLATSHGAANAGSPISWIELVFGLPVIALWFWCADQTVVQKALSVRYADVVKKTAIVSGFIQVIPIAIFMLPSIIALTLSHHITEGDPLQLLIAGGSMPDNLRGGAIFSGASVFMIAFATLFNSTSSLFTFDFYQRYHPDASDRTLVLVGRLTTMAVLFLAILFIPVCQLMTINASFTLLKTFIYFFAMLSSVAAMGMLTPRITSANAMLTLTVGTIVVCARVLYELIYSDLHFTYGPVQWFARSSTLEFSLCVCALSTSLLLFSSAAGQLYDHVILKHRRSFIL
jgi:solute:Na+ symporter, SSS family